MISALVIESAAYESRIAAAFDAGLGGQVGHLLEGRDEFRPAIGIAAVIEGVDSQEDIRRPEHLRLGQGKDRKMVFRAGT